ncbi:hypothetical protein DICVIV_05795 [Dictyocaulus viviparus]|uniref:Chondroitin proteoglycan 4 domain-containing protein n=1 Tax=Dictyocaulus viviparus TaxID=29172 RepID=A0A0D8XWD4_DICVI|nr:hypothetical protein DICVIV_05795 [Dictyocaulus viviparus]
MMQHYYIVLISTVFLIVNNGELKTNKDQIAQSFNPDVLIRALGVPICVRKCIDQFVKDVADLWYMNEIVGNIQPFCRSHDAALKCIGRYATCDPHRLFKMASSSVEKMCGERAPLFEKMRPCLAKYGDIPVQVCDSRCHGSSNITAFMNNPAITIAAKMGGNIFTVNEHLGGLCSALNCALPCITMELNKVCPLSGWLTLVGFTCSEHLRYVNIYVNKVNSIIITNMEIGSRLFLMSSLSVVCVGKVVQLKKGCNSVSVKAVCCVPVESHLSPLDDFKPNADLEPNLWAYGSEYVVEPPMCQTACISSVMEVFSVYFRSGTFSDNMRQACNSYEEAIKCMKRNAHCGPDSMFESLTSGLRYMCKEQRDAFTILSDCINRNTDRVSHDCDQQCNPNSLATGIALKDTVMTQLDHPLVSQNVNMRRIIEPHMSRFFFSHACKIGQCLMGCTRNKYNMLCEGTAGSLLLEMLTLPLSVDSGESSAFPSTSHIASFLGGLLPHQCSFLTARNGNSYRIDPELNKEIKRMYANRNRTTMLLPSSLSPHSEVVDPFLKMSNTLKRVSPFEDYEIAEKLLEDGTDSFHDEVYEEPVSNIDIPEKYLTGEGWSRSYYDYNTSIWRWVGHGVNSHNKGYTFLSLLGSGSYEHSDITDVFDDFEVLTDEPEKYFVSYPVKSGKKYKLQMNSDYTDTHALQANLSVPSNRRDREGK